MKEAVTLARRGTGSTYPNPSVGAVLVKRGKVVGKGRSSPVGGPHAEALALRDAGDAARGADLYVTLEPCSHQGRTPPCADAVVKAGVARVFIGVKDPNPLVAGRGIARMRRAGIEVRVGVAEDLVEDVHEHYLFAQREGRPFVTLKAAISIDGRIATAGGDSKWITGEAARKEAHRLRARHHAIAVGAQTLLDDDPALTVRMVRGIDPRVVVFDPRLRCAAAGPSRPRALRAGSLVLHARGARADRVKRLRDWGVEAQVVASMKRGGKVLLKVDRALHALARRELRSLMVEGGGRLLGAFVGAGLFEELHVFDAPVILGEGRPVFGWGGPRSVQRAPRLERTANKLLGEDRLSIYRRPR